MSHARGSLGHILGMADGKPSQKRQKSVKAKDRPISVKGMDVELPADGGGRVNTDAQRAFTPQAPKKDTRSAVERLVDKTPFGKAAKVLKRER